MLVTIFATVGISVILNDTPLAAVLLIDVPTIPPVLLVVRLADAFEPNVELNVIVSALELLGADVDFVKKYLQNKFLKGMTWDNWSRDGWHIDHIIPLSSFDLTKIEEQKKAFHYTNLQPLWAVDNLKKGDKIE